MPDGGVLTIRSRAERLAPCSKSPIPAKAFRPNIWPAFTIPSSPPKAPKKGTGLGLSISYGIVHEHDGVIEVDSSVGGGTRFRLEFPGLAVRRARTLTPAPEALPAYNMPLKNTTSATTVSSGFPNQALPADRVGPPERRRILVIDDEADIRESLELLLTSENYSVDLAENATVGLQKFDSGNHDLILLDLMMPDRSGMEVLVDIRQRDQETPIFMLTAYGSEEVAVRALKSGANDYFPKPWDNDKLLIEIDRMISKGRLERENTQLKRALKQRYAFPNIVGKSERMLRLLDQVAQVAPSRATI